MCINLAVIYTEYQLLQSEAIIRHYNLKNVILLIHNKNDRIKDWLIDYSLFDKVLQLPIKETSRVYKLSRKYIQYYSSIISDILQNKKVNVLLGAQDENTIYAIVKYYAKPKYYWNIEDGNANYLCENFRYRLEIFTKKMLFSLYGYRKLDIRYGHGLVKSDKAFRLYPKISIDKKSCIYLGDILGNYLKGKIEMIQPKVAWIEKYNQFDTLIVSVVSSLPIINKTISSNDLYKFHPEDKIETEEVNYIKEHIPIEFLPFLLTNIKTIRYQIYSSSILNMLVLHPDIKIQLDYLPPNKAYTFYTKNIIQEFGNRIEVIQC